MKKLIIFLLLIASFFARGQGTNVFKYLELKNVDTVGLTRAGQFWYNPTVGKFTFHDGSGYKHFGTATGSFWPLTGSATLTGTVNVNGAQTVNIGTGTALTAFNVTTTGGYLQLGAATAGLVAFGSNVTLSNTVASILGPNGTGVNQFKLGEISTGPSVIGAKFTVGGVDRFTITEAGVYKFLPAVAPNIGQVPTATNTDGTWTWQTPSSGGTPGGSNTQFQYNNSSAFGGATGLTYNSGTSVVTLSQIPVFSAGIGSATATTQSAADNSTKVATTAYVDGAALGPFSTVAPGYTNLSGGTRKTPIGDNSWLSALPSDIGGTGIVNNVASTWTISGAFGTTVTVTGTTAVTFPNSGTLATLAGTETLSNKTLTTPKIITGGFISDTNGNEQLIFSTVSSAVNEWTVKNAATGASPSFTATGGDTNIPIDISSKGSGRVKFNYRNATGPPMSGVGYDFFMTDDVNFYRYSTDAVSTSLNLYKARGTTSPATVVNSDVTGLLNFYAHDGAAFFNTAQVKAVINGTVATNTLPTDLVFYTTATNSLTEALRITSTGVIKLGTSSTSGYVWTASSTDGSGGWAVNSGGGWPFTGTGTFTGAVLIDETTTGGNTLKFKSDNLGVTQVDGKGVWLYNSTAAGAGAQQISPGFTLEGQGWKVNATAASQSVKFAQYVTPIQGTANPSGSLDWYTSINGGAYANLMTLLSSGNLGIGVTAPTARLHLAAGTATAGTAPIQLTSGTNLTSPVAGTLEYSAGVWYITDSGPTRYRIAGVSTSGLSSQQVGFGQGNHLIVGSGNLTFVTNRLIGTTLYLTVSAGTATAGTAPIKFTAGTLLTTPEAFAIESNANSFYQTKNSTLRYGQGGVIFDNIADANNGTTVETDLYSYTTPANTLAEDGDKIVCSYVGTFNDVTATGQLKVYFAGTAIGNTGALTISATGGWVAQVMLIRTSSTTARAAVNISTPGASTALYTAETDLTSLTLSGTNILKITGQAGGASGGSNDITAKFSMGYFFPTAHN